MAKETFQRPFKGLFLNDLKASQGAQEKTMEEARIINLRVRAIKLKPDTFDIYETPESLKRAQNSPLRQTSYRECIA